MTERAGARCLSDAIESYRTEHEGKLDKEALDLLSRLTKSPDASEAFKGLGPLSRRAEAVVLAACIYADQVARNFRRQAQQQKDALTRSKQWHKALGELRNFVADIAEEKESLRVELPNQDLWSLSVFEPPADNNSLKRALDLIAQAIEWRCGIAQANLAHLGITRKMHTEEAAENAAIWVLAAGVYDAMRNPPLCIERQGNEVADVNLLEIADLAQVILGAERTEITTERVREVRRRGRRDYLKMVRVQTERRFREKVAKARRSTSD